MNSFAQSLAFALLVGPGIHASAQEVQPAPKVPSIADQLKRAKPGPEHEKLVRYSGEWDLEIKMRPNTIYQGRATNLAIVGGRFLQIEYQTKGSRDSIDGIFTVGFDPRHERFTMIAMDSFGPYFVTSQGKRDEATGIIKMLGTDDDPAVKAMGYTKEFIHALDLRGPDEFTIEIYFINTRTPERREMKFMTYTFKRKAA